MNINSVNSAAADYTKKNSNTKSSATSENGSFANVLDNLSSSGIYARGAVTVSSPITELSEQAQAYLGSLKEKFGDTDFIIADFSTEAEAKALLNQGSGTYNCVITPELLERMAADEDVGAEYEAVIQQSNDNIDRIRDELGDINEYLTELGFIVGSDGIVTFYASMKQDDQAYDVSASTVEDLLNKLRNPDSYDIHKEYYEQMLIGI